MNEQSTYEAFRSALQDGFAIVAHQVHRFREKEIDQFAEIYRSNISFVADSTHHIEGFKIAQVFSHGRYKNIKSWDSFLSKYTKLKYPFSLSVNTVFAQFIEHAIYTHGLTILNEKLSKKLFDEWESNLPLKNPKSEYIIPLINFELSNGEYKVDNKIRLDKASDNVSFHLRELNTTKAHYTHDLIIADRNGLDNDLSFYRNRAQIALSIFLRQKASLPFIFAKPTNYSLGWQGPYKHVLHSTSNDVQTSNGITPLSKDKLEHFKHILVSFIYTKDLRTEHLANLLLRMSITDSIMEKIYLLRDAFNALLIDENETDVSYYKIKIRTLLLVKRAKTDVNDIISTLDTLFQDKNIFQRKDLNDTCALAFELLSICILMICLERKFDRASEIDTLLLG